MLHSTTKTVAVAGIRERLSPTRVPAAWVMVQPLVGNGNSVYVGDSTVSATRGTRLLNTSPPVLFPFMGGPGAYDLYDIWVDAAVNTEGISISYGA